MTNKTVSAARRTFIINLLLISAITSFTSAVQAQQKRLELLSYDELIQLYEQKNPPAILQQKLERLLTTPLVNNSANSRGIKPLLPRTAKLGQSIRLVQWNIERGLEYEAIRTAFTETRSFARFIDAKEYPPGSAKRRKIMQQVALLKQADVIVLNEVDAGMKRSEYRDIAAALAEALKMNYAFGVEFVEVDPIALGLEKFEELPEKERTELVKEITVDPKRYRGLHGTAILSRFALENVRLEPFTHQPHDWYEDELKGVQPIESGRRKAGELIFQEKVLREIRRGGRMMLTAEIADERIPGGRLTIVATHLENKSKPEGRRKQLDELLERIREIKTPVVVAGDMNTTTQDGKPLSVQRLIKNRLGSKSFWIKQGLGLLTGIKLPTMLLSGVNAYRRQADPTVRSVPLVATNPEAEFFDNLKDFRFADGSAFDFRGERERSAGGMSGPLANSNERGDKGFITTFEVDRTVAFVGKFKLDWIFVKPPDLTDPYAKDGPYQFAPHFGVTLKSVNDALPDRISDHSPLMVDLPLREPPIGRKSTVVARPGGAVLRAPASPRATSEGNRF